MREDFPSVLSEVVNFNNVSQIAVSKPSSCDYDLEFIDSTRSGILPREYHVADLLPLLGDNVVSGASPFLLLLFRAVASEHVDEALTVAHSLLFEMLVHGVRLLFQHQLILVVK